MEATNLAGEYPIRRAIAREPPTAARMAPQAGGVGGYPVRGMPVDEEERSGWLHGAKEALVDIALFAGAGAIAGAAGATGVGLPLATGILYGAGKYAQGKIEGAPEETLTEMISGEKFSPVASGITQMAEGALFASPLIGKALKPVAKLIGGASKSVLRGVDYATAGQLNKLSAKAAPASDWMLNNVVIWPFQRKIPSADRTLQEIFQPGVERLASSKDPILNKAASSIRESVVQQKFGVEAASNLGKELNTTMKPSEFMEFKRGIVDRRLAVSPKAQSAIQRFDKIVGDTGMSTPYYQVWQDTVQKHLNKAFTDPLSEHSPDVYKMLLEPFERKLPPDATWKQARKGLEEIINHPNVTDVYKRFATDLWSVPAKLPKEVAKASREASLEYMTQKLASNRGLIVPEEIGRKKAGYELSTCGKWEGMYIPRDLNLQLKDMAKIERLATSFGHRLMTMWKSGKTILRPAYHLRNSFSNPILNDMGGLPFWRVDHYIDSFKFMRKKTELWPKFSKATGHSGNFVRNDLNLTGEGLEYGANIFDKMYYIFNKAAQYPGSLQDLEEQFFKFAKYRHSIIEKGMSHAEAIADAHKYILNYGEASIGAAQLRKGAMPFATWYTKVVPLFVETAVKHPFRIGKWLAFGAALQNYAIDQTDISNDEWESIHNDLPDYMRNGMYLLMPWRDNKDNLNMFNATWLMPGMGDINELVNLVRSTSGSGLQIPNPGISMVAALASKKKSSGAPLYFDWEPTKTKFAKIAHYAWDQLSPAVFTDYQKIQDAITEEEGAPPLEQAALSGMGLKLTSIDPWKLANNRRVLNTIHEQELTSQMHKELRGSKTADKTSAILKKYQDIRFGESFKR